MTSALYSLSVLITFIRSYLVHNPFKLQVNIFTSLFWRSCSRWLAAEMIHVLIPLSILLISSSVLKKLWNICLLFSSQDPTLWKQTWPFLTTPMQYSICFITMPYKLHHIKKNARNSLVMVYPVLVALRITPNYRKIGIFCISPRTGSNISLLSAQNYRTGHSDQNEVLHDIKHVNYKYCWKICLNLCNEGITYCTPHHYKLAKCLCQWESHWCV